MITLSPAGAEIPGQRCEAPISIPADPELLKQQRYDDAIRAACDALSALGVQNFIHWEWDNNNQQRATLVELIDQRELFLPVIHHTTNSVELRERAHA